MIRMMPPGKFNSDTGVWYLAQNNGANVSISELTVVTFNVWFDQYYQQERCQALLRVIRDCNADIICLQEITFSFLKQLLQLEWVQANYYVSDCTGNTIQPYGVLLLSRMPIALLRWHDLPSMMARRLLVAELKINNQITQIATAHLESTRLFGSVRKQQLELIFPALEKSKHAVLMGDFNFCSSNLAENANLNPDYQDMWPVLKNGQPGYTEDTDVNLMRLEKTGRHKQVRYDRILVRSSISGWQPKSIELLGTTPISANYPAVFPSDHFGLVGRLVWNSHDDKMPLETVPL